MPWRVLWRWACQVVNIITFLKDVISTYVAGQPPTNLISTICFFALLTWCAPEAGGTRGHGQTPPPSRPL